jgi:mRNA interferase MazF
MIVRGSVLTISARGKVRGKPRPAIAIQADGFDFPETLIVVPLTTHEADPNIATPRFEPDKGNGLESPSFAMIQRMGAVEKTDVGDVIGALSEDDLQRLNSAIAMVLGLDAA